MKTRVATGAVLGAGMLALFFYLPPVFAVTAFGVFCAAGARELLFTTKSVPEHPFLYFCFAAAFCVPFVVIYGLAWQLSAFIFGFAAIAIMFGVICHSKINYSAMTKGIFAAIALPLMLCSVLRIRFIHPLGVYFVMAPWLTVWVCDSAAFFVGKAIGKRRLAPYVSPKKTVAGFIGGLAGGVLIMLAYAFVLTSFELPADTLAYAVYGLVGAAAGQMGDLGLSVIKREAGLKDYGRLFPGHGGVWDRFDSIILAAPIYELLFFYILPTIN